MLMYNFVSAFAACLVIILLGEVLSKFTKGWVPSVFISAVLILIAFWTARSSSPASRRSRAASWPPR